MITIILTALKDDVRIADPVILSEKYEFIDENQADEFMQEVYDWLDHRPKLNHSFVFPKITKYVTEQDLIDIIDKITEPV